MERQQVANVGTLPAKPAAGKGVSQDQQQQQPGSIPAAAAGSSPSQASPGCSEQQPQDPSTASRRETLLQSALALFMPPGQVPAYASITPAAATAAASDSAPSLPSFTESRELQLVAAAFAAGAAAGAAGQMQQGTLDPFGSGDASNSGFALPESAAPAAADGGAESLPAAAPAAATALAEGGRQRKAARSRSINSSGSAGASHKSTYRGVFWDRKNNRWRAQVGHNNRKIFMGYFSEPTEAARAYDKKLVQLRGTMGE